MEERIIDREREIKIKRKRNGDDVQDALAEDESPEAEAAEGVEENVVLDFPEEGDEDYDEALVGLTPEQLQAELNRREKEKREAAAAQEKLVGAGKEKLQAKNYAEAEVFFAQSLVYGKSDEAEKLLWRARTKEFSDTSAFYRLENAEEFAAASDEVRGFVLEKAGGALEAEREEARRIAIPLREKVEAAIAERRVPFGANKKYYAVRFRVSFGVLLLCALWAIISGSMIYSTEGMLPVWLTIAAGVCALVSLGFAVFFARKLHEAKKLCEANEKISSTEEGARLEEIETRLKCYKLIFEKE